jgi:hypothetical protein
MLPLILELLQSHKALTGREIGEVIDSEHWPDHITQDLQELMDQGRIVRNPLAVKQWDCYTWSLK